LDDAAPGVAADASGQGHEAKPTNVVRSEGRNGASAIRFDGRGYVECGGLGTHEAISIALWVKPDTLGSQWSPLLFCNDGKPGAVHFSLLPDGRPNVAINTGGWNWTHRKGNVSLADGTWHHVVLVADARFNGKARFYVDGNPAGESHLSFGRRLDLSGFRLGAWNGWQDNPANNFHGQLADVRIFSGTLTIEEAARLVTDTRADGRGLCQQ
jgi:hypothetical protein